MRRNFVITLLLLLTLAGFVFATNTYSGGVSGSAAGNALLRSTGDHAMGGSVASDDLTTFTINTTPTSGTAKVSITAASGNTAIAGTLGVTGAATVQGAFNFAADAGANDTYVITLAPAPAAYTTGMYIAFTANTANTGACTINVNSLGAKSLKRGVSTDPGDNYIKAGSVVVALYDGTNFQIVTPAAQ